jgi:hypothetical protein
MAQLTRYDINEQGAVAKQRQTNGWRGVFYAVRAEVIYNENMQATNRETQMGLETKTYWPTGRRS